MAHKPEWKKRMVEIDGIHIFCKALNGSQEQHICSIDPARQEIKFSYLTAGTVERGGVCISQASCFLLPIDKPKQ